MKTTRRSLLLGASSLAAQAAASSTVKIVEFHPDGSRKSVTTVEKLRRTDAEWRKQLTPEQFDVTRLKGTERAFTGKLWDNHADGIYSCVCCGTALFDSRTKFESGTGWPSFFQPIAKENVREITDISYGMQRVEVVCKRCDGHLGHVFDDGPRPSRLRYCMNSASMTFAPRGSKSI